MFYYTYKTTNTINGKYYYGYHVSKSLTDSYLGSGKALVKAIKKYGRASFIREIVEIYPSREKLIEGEINLITVDVVKDPMSYNMKAGGCGGSCPEDWDDVRRERVAKKQRGRKRSEESKKKQGKTYRQNGNSQWNDGETLAPEHIEKVRLSLLGNDRAKGKKHKNPDSKLGKMKIRSPEGVASFVFPDEVDFYLEQGYICWKLEPKIVLRHPNGTPRIIMKRKKDEYLAKGFTLIPSREDWQAGSADHYKTQALKRIGKVVVYDHKGKRKFISLNDIPVYLEQGYLLSKLAIQKTTDKNFGIPVPREIRRKNLSKGSRKRWDGAKNTIVIKTPDGKRKFIQREELDVYLEQGYTYSFPRPRKK